MTVWIQLFHLNKKLELSVMTLIEMLVLRRCSVIYRELFNFRFCGILCTFQ